MSMSINSFLFEQASRFYEIEDTAARGSFAKLNERECVTAVVESATASAFDLRTIMGAIYAGAGIKKETKGIEQLARIPLYRGILNSDGNIKKVPEYEKCRSLLMYALETNSRYPTKDDSINRFNANAQKILDLMKLLEVAAPKFKKAIDAELHTNFTVIRQTYVSFVFLVLTTTDTLYSQSISVTFKPFSTPPVAEYVAFNCPETLVPLQMEMIDRAMDVLRSGALFSNRMVLSEHFEHIFSPNVLNEGFMDAVFGLVTHFKITDLFLLAPIYLARAITYWMIFTYESVGGLITNIDRSIELQRNRNLSQEEYDAYKKETAKTSARSEQALGRAEVTIEMATREDKAQLNRMQQSGIVL